MLHSLFPVSKLPESCISMYVAEDYALDVFLCSHCLCDPRGKLFSGNFQQEMSNAECRVQNGLVISRCRQKLSR